MAVTDDSRLSRRCRRTPPGAAASRGSAARRPRSVAAGMRAPFAISGPPPQRMPRSTSRIMSARFIFPRSRAGDALFVERRKPDGAELLLEVLRAARYHSSATTAPREPRFLHETVRECGRIVPSGASTASVVMPRFVTAYRAIARPGRRSRRLPETPWDLCAMPTALPSGEQRNAGRLGCLRAAIASVERPADNPDHAEVSGKLRTTFAQRPARVPYRAPRAIPSSWRTVRRVFCQRGLDSS